MVDVNGHQLRKSISIVLVMRDDLLREGLAVLLGDRIDIVVAGMWSRSDEALAGIGHLKPSVALLDVNLPDCSRDALSQFLDHTRQVSPETRVVAIASCPPERCIMGKSPAVCCTGNGTQYIAYDERSELETCLQVALDHGAFGVMHRPTNSELVAAAVRCVATGQHWIDLPTALRRAARTAFAGSRTVSAVRDTSRLSVREREIAHLIASGYSNKDVARELCLAYSTVKNHVSGILDKLRLESRTQLVRYSLDHPDET
jgi:DNA-binding NarL/FixJ family response regulator